MLCKFEKKQPTKQAWRTITLLKGKTRVLSLYIPDLRTMGERVESTDSCRTVHPRYFQCPNRKYTPNFGHPKVVSSVSPLYLKRHFFSKSPCGLILDVHPKKTKSNLISYFLLLQSMAFLPSPLAKHSQLGDIHHHHKLVQY